MIDVSAVGSFVHITGGSNRKVDIYNFSDEGTPFEFNEIEVTGSALTLNGELVLWAKPVAYTASVTVLSGSDEDIVLHDLLEDYHVKTNGAQSPAKVGSRNACTLSLNIPRPNGQGMKTYQYSNGRIVGGPSAPSASVEGRLSSRTYTFVFEKLV